jgi:hypothetical protein
MSIQAIPETNPDTIPDNHFLGAETRAPRALKSPMYKAAAVARMSRIMNMGSTISTSPFIAFSP